MTAFTLKSGFVVQFRETYTHGMERAFNLELTKGLSLKQVNGEVVVDEIKADALDRAVEAVLQLLIEKITTKDGQATPYSSEWLAALPEIDFKDLSRRVEAIREQNESQKAVGKKNP